MTTGSESAASEWTLKLRTRSALEMRRMGFVPLGRRHDRMVRFPAPCAIKALFGYCKARFEESASTLATSRVLRGALCQAKAVSDQLALAIRAIALPRLALASGSCRRVRHYPHTVGRHASASAKGLSKS